LSITEDLCAAKIAGQTFTVYERHTRPKYRSSQWRSEAK